MIFVESHPGLIKYSEIRGDQVEVLDSQCYPIEAPRSCGDQSFCSDSKLPELKGCLTLEVSYSWDP